jgi:cytosine/adenosine deaminase-related metal-dependent hydrolase
MESRKNLTRFTYETAAFEGWRLCVSRAGTTFTKYFSDKHYGSEKKALQAAEKSKEKLLLVVDSSRRINGKLSKSTVEKIEQLLKSS